MEANSRSGEERSACAVLTRESIVQSTLHDVCDCHKRAEFMTARVTWPRPRQLYRLASCHLHPGSLEMPWHQSKVVSSMALSAMRGGGPADSGAVTVPPWSCASANIRRAAAAILGRRGVWLWQGG